VVSRNGEIEEHTSLKVITKQLVTLVIVILMHM
jgi:hypothetical protein